MKPLFAICIMSTLLFGCNQSSTKQEDANKVNPTAYSIGGGNKVVFLDDYYTDYMKVLKTDLKKSDSLYAVKVKSPILSNYFSTCEFGQLIDYSFISVTDTNAVERNMAAIEANKEKIEKVISSTLVDCNKYLKNDSITVYIQPFEGGYMEKVIKRMGGVAAVTGGSKQIVLTIDADVASWSDVISATLAHEYNHAYWTKMNFKNPANKWDMLNYLVFEGRADSYSHFVYPTKLSAWDTALSDKEKADLWAKIKPKLQSLDMSFQREVMFGGKDGYPIWGGYCLGYTIVQSALKNNPNLKPEEWAILSPEKILEMSDYK